MKCKNCGFEIFDGKADVCPKCGKQVNKDEFLAWAKAVIISIIIAVPLFAGSFVNIFFAGMLFSAQASVSGTFQSSRNRTLFRKDLATLNQALLQSISFDNAYSSTDMVWNKGIKEQLIITKDIPDGIVLADLTEIKYQKLRNNCTRKPVNTSEINKQTACAILTIDTDGFEKGLNRQSEIDNIADRFTVLMYSDAVLPVPNSVEDKIIKF